MLPRPISSPDIDFLRDGLASLNHVPVLRHSHVCIVRRKVILGGAADRLRGVDTVQLSIPSVAEDAATLNIFQIDRYWLVVEKCPQLSLDFPSPRFIVPLFKFNQLMFCHINHDRLNRSFVIPINLPSHISPPNYRAVLVQETLPVLMKFLHEDKL